MRITRVYTRTGDRGTTRLVGGTEVPKDDVRIEAYGTVDEANATLGLARAHLAASTASPDDRARVDATLAEVQNDLFSVGADLATPSADRWPGMILPNDAWVARLERTIDAYNDELEPLREFILPGPGPVGATLHVARCVTRRAERHVAALLRQDPGLGDGSLRYLNRLSDLLFVLARWSARACGEPEAMWRKPG